MQNLQTFLTDWSLAFSSNVSLEWKMGILFALLELYSNCKQLKLYHISCYTNMHKQHIRLIQLICGHLQTNWRRLPGFEMKKLKITASTICSWVECHGINRATNSQNGELVPRLHGNLGKRCQELSTSLRSNVKQHTTLRFFVCLAIRPCIKSRSLYKWKCSESRLLAFYT